MKSTLCVGMKSTSIALGSEPVGHEGEAATISYAILDIAYLQYRPAGE